MHTYSDKDKENYSLDFLKKKCCIRKLGVSMLDISRAAKAIGFETTGEKVNIEQLKQIVQYIPAILGKKIIS